MLFHIHERPRMREARAGAGEFPGAAEPSVFWKLPGAAEPSVFGKFPGAAEPSVFADFPDSPAAPQEEVRATGKDILAMILAVWSMLMPVVLGTGAILALLCWALL